MTWYQFWKFLHVGFAVLWVGGGAMIQFFALRALRSQDNERTVEFAADVEVDVVAVRRGVVDVTRLKAQKRGIR